MFSPETTAKYTQASQALQDLVCITNFADKSFTLQIFVDSPDIINTISYTLTMESNVRNCIEIRRMSSNYTEDRYLEDCQNCIVQMENALQHNSQYARVKNNFSS